MTDRKLGKKRDASPELLATLSDNLKRLRQLKEISQEQLAFDAGVHRTFISLIERCDRNVTIGTVEMLADALEVNVPTLLTKHKRNWDGL